METVEILGPLAVTFHLRDSVVYEARGGIASADARQVEINDMIWKARDRQRGADAFFATGPATAVFQGD